MLVLTLFISLIIQPISSSIITYDRQTLLDIGQNVPKLSTTSVIPVEIIKIPETCCSGNQRRYGRKRGIRGGLLVRLRNRPTRPPIPSMLLANMQSISNKMDELRCRVSIQRDLGNCCVFCFTETWLTSDYPDSAVHLDGFSVFRLDRAKDTTGKSKGGGVCFFINNSWCTDAEVISHSCSPVLEHLSIKCRPFYAPREFPSVLLTAVYIPPQANAK